MTILFPNEPSYFVPEKLDDLLIFCYENGASDISIQSGERVFAEVRGLQIKVTQRELTLQEVSDLINHIYGANATALIFSGTDIDVSYRVKRSEEKQYRYRVNITACAFESYQGLQVTLRTISSEPPLLSDMHLSSELESNLKIPQGIVVVSGATGSGKSTLLASIIADFAKQKDSNLKILTYESPIEYVYDSVEKPSTIISQTEIPRYLPSFAAGVRNALRRKPGLILVGEARDKETIEAVIDAALTGHPVYTTVHSNGVADTLRRMLTIFPHAERDARMFDLLETVKVIIWQTLVPTPDGQRTALREYLVITEEVRDILIDGKTDAIVSRVRKILSSAGKPLIVDAKEKYEAGTIDKKVFDLIEKHRGGG
ncbi:MAG: Dot/Icm secretion system ATPase DotB [Thiotrichales bacterium]|nr:MAG: Dot/Icm secretion system ATPase DotB [Thiotrichales bacterium]